jgi:hypothetical protein
MGDEVDGQGQGLDTLHSRAETTVGRIKDVNNKSQLRKFSVSGNCEPKDQKGIACFLCFGASSIFVYICVYKTVMHLVKWLHTLTKCFYLQCVKWASQKPLVELGYLWRQDMHGLIFFKWQEGGGSLNFL